MDVEDIELILVLPMLPLYLVLPLGLLILALKCKSYKKRDFYLFCSLLFKKLFIDLRVRNRN